jgi:predicted kinase
LVGLPGSGKSTWTSKFLAKESEPYTVISSDDVIEEFAKKEGKTYTEVFKDYIGQATMIVKERFRDAVKNRDNIIWDQTNMNIKKRKSILQQLPPEYEKTAVIFTVDEPELKRRLQTRQELTGKHIPEFVLKDMARSYQAPTKAEGFDYILRA